MNVVVDKMKYLSIIILFLINSCKRECISGNEEWPDVVLTIKEKGIPSFLIRGNVFEKKENITFDSDVGVYRFLNKDKKTYFSVSCGSKDSNENDIFVHISFKDSPGVLPCFFVKNKNNIVRLNYKEGICDYKINILNNGSIEIIPIKKTEDESTVFP